MSAVRGYPFYNHYYSQELEVCTFKQQSSELIITLIRNRDTGKVFFRYVSLDWDQAARWHQKAIEKLVLLNARVEIPF